MGVCVSHRLNAQPGPTGSELTVTSAPPPPHNLHTPAEMCISKTPRLTPTSLPPTLKLFSGWENAPNSYLFSGENEGRRGVAIALATQLHSISLFDQAPRRFLPQLHHGGGVWRRENKHTDTQDHINKSYSAEVTWQSLFHHTDWFSSNSVTVATRLLKTTSRQFLQKQKWALL